MSANRGILYSDGSGSSSVDNKTLSTPIDFHGQHFIVNSVGKSLCLESDNRSVICDSFENSGKHQWFVVRQVNEEFFVLSARSGKFLKVVDSTSPHPVLVCTSLPFSWEISQDGRGFNLTLPNSTLGISLDDTASLAPQATRLYILENNPQNEATIKSGRIDQDPDPLITTNAGGNIINITINNSSGSTSALSQLEAFFKSDGTRNLAIYLGDHQIINSGMMGSPLAGPDLGNPFTIQKKSGFPTGYFRIRSVSSSTYYLCGYNNPSYYGSDGLPIRLVNGLTRSEERRSIHKEIFFVNPMGELCCDSGQVDVINNVLLVSRQRPPTAPWPNPWSHPFPTFSYSSDTKMISVKFQYDPLLSANYPRPEKEWKEKEFLLLEGLSTKVNFPLISDLKRWTPGDMSIPWFGIPYSMDPSSYTSVGVVDKTELGKIMEAERSRLQWVIERL